MRAFFRNVPVCIERRRVIQQSIPRIKILGHLVGGHWKKYCVLIENKPAQYRAKQDDGNAFDTYLNHPNRRVFCREVMAAPIAMVMAGRTKMK